jgi:membrane associated rhomboid family serine protease
METRKMKMTNTLILNPQLASPEDFVTARQESIMPGTTPMPVSVRMVRAFVSMFKKVGAAHTLANGSALWVYIEWCNLNHIPYTLELHHQEKVPTHWIIRGIQL